MLEGLKCPKCGSTRLAIVAGSQLALKCMDCGYVWVPRLVESGYSTVNGRQVHWTEVEAAKEKMLVELREAMVKTAQCSEVKAILAKYRGFMDTDDLLRVFKHAITQAAPTLRVKGEALYERYRASMMQCIEEYLKESSSQPP